jgi:hypothetical protein
MQLDDVLARRAAYLRRIVRQSFDSAPEHVQGFVSRCVDGLSLPSGEPPLFKYTALPECFESARFGGYPALARSGYCFAQTDYSRLTLDSAVAFFRWLNHQRQRPENSQCELAGDSIALLGIADGLRAIEQLGLEEACVNEARTWLCGLLQQHGTSDPRLSRVRLLAGDLLDRQGRLGWWVVPSNDPYEAALDLCLWRTWPEAFRSMTHPEVCARRSLFKHLLMDPSPVEGGALHAASWLCALDVLVSDISEHAIPDVHQVVRILTASQGSFKRWRWEERTTRKGATPARWLIDKEADVQAFLLALLYPFFREQLEDEQYLRGFGLRQGRFDFAITSLRLIVEVKVLRTSDDIKELEAQVTDDLSLYFKESNPFDSMVIYIYDDRDKPEPERYPAMQDAFKRRSSRITDVVIVQRPSMIPNRDQRH